ncbi:MAG: 30S ribosome-binding factor RbfA [Bacteroidales bacterium]|nr:30S ribosome-binding factor RbfA [Bacteroidales bacterium]
MESKRQQKVAKLLQKELGTYFQRHGNEILPGKMISVTVVRVSPDLGFVKVYVSIFPFNKDENPIEAIRAKASLIRNYIGNKVKNQLRAVPEFAYYLDDSLDYIDNIDNLLKE